MEKSTIAMSVLIGKLDREGELVHFLCFFFFRKIILPTRFTSEKHFFDATTNCYLSQNWSCNRCVLRSYSG